MEGAQRYLEAKERWLVGSEDWAEATAAAFLVLAQKECAEVAKPEWWNDEGLKALSARVVRAAPNDAVAHQVRAEVLTQKACGEVAKPEWWNDEGLLALSAKVVRAAPNDEASHGMRAIVLGGQCHVLESGTRSAAELKKAATHWERAVALCKAPAVKAQYAGYAVHCRILAADAM